VDAYWSHRPDVESHLRHIVADQDHRAADRLGGISMTTLVMIGDRDTQAMGAGVRTEQFGIPDGPRPQRDDAGDRGRRARILLAVAQAIGRDPSGVDRYAPTGATNRTG